MAGERLARAIKQSRPKESEFSDLIYGQVISTDPLNIRLENRFEISAPFIELSQMVKNLTIAVNVEGKIGYATVFRDLEVGDKVRMLRAQKSQKYYVIERV
ncbi:DUF2577 family protein [Enterococcus sp. DIV1420a]|uniref:DUF2577 family protein n=1 Tax=Enterococcus sp. DIV1420a TaxID=2774672 RepID=UPI003F20C663